MERGRSIVVLFFLSLTGAAIAWVATPPPPTAPPPAFRTTASSTWRLQASTRHEADAISAAVISDTEKVHMQQLFGAKADTYGELTPAGFRQLFARHGLGPSDVFADLGSGTGKLVLQAAAEYGVRSSIGVEFSRTRHELAMENLAAAPQSVAERVVLICGDAAGDRAAEECRVATAVWIANLLFGDELQANLAQRLARMPSLRLVAALKPLPGGVAGFEQDELPSLAETSWTAAQSVQAGHPPMPGFPCVVYRRVGEAEKTPPEQAELDARYSAVMMHLYDTPKRK